MSLFAQISEEAKKEGKNQPQSKTPEKVEKEKQKKENKKVETEAHITIIFNPSSNTFSAALKVGNKVESVTSESLNEITDYLSTLIKAEIFRKPKKEKKKAEKQETKKEEEQKPISLFGF